jgi:NAD(P)H-nitrite reductase large subunit
MPDRPKGAIIQRDKKTYGVVPRMPLGIVTPDTLETIANVVRKYEIPIIKITSAQRMALVGMKPEVVDDVWRDLGIDVGPAVELCVHYVQACPGNTLCKLGVQNRHIRLFHELWRELHARLWRLWQEVRMDSDLRG